MAGTVYLVNLDDVLKGSQVLLCETVVIFHFGHGDDSVWQVQYFVAGAVLCRPWHKSG